MRKMTMKRMQRYGAPSRATKNKMARKCAACGMTYGVHHGNRCPGDEGDVFVPFKKGGRRQLGGLDGVSVGNALLVIFVVVPAVTFAAGAVLNVFGLNPVTNYFNAQRDAQQKLLAHSS